MKRAHDDLGEFGTLLSSVKEDSITMLEFYILYTSLQQEEMALAYLEALEVGNKDAAELLKQHINHFNDTKISDFTSAEVMACYAFLTKKLTAYHTLLKSELMPKFKIPSLNIIMTCAVQYGFVEMVKYLVSLGADIRAEYDDAVRHAAENGHLEMVKYLVSLGADIRAADDAALRHAAKNGHLEMVKYLVSLGADIRAENDCAIRYAAGNGHLEMVKYLVSLGADIRAENDCAIRDAAGNGHLEMVKYLVSEGADIRAEDDDAVRYAAENGHLEMVKYLVSLGADIRAEDDGAVCNAAENQHYHVLCWVATIVNIDEILKNNAIYQQYSKVNVELLSKVNPHVHNLGTLGWKESRVLQPKMFAVLEMIYCTFWDVPFDIVKLLASAMLGFEFDQEAYVKHHVLTQIIIPREIEVQMIDCPGEYAAKKHLALLQCNQVSTGILAKN